MEWNRLLSNKHFAELSQENDGFYRNDYDTIICSTLFRRLQDKAQVFPLDEDDYIEEKILSMYTPASIYSPSQTAL